MKRFDTCKSKLTELGKLFSEEFQIIKNDDVFATGISGFSGDCGMYADLRIIGVSRNGDKYRLTIICTGLTHIRVLICSYWGDDIINTDLADKIFHRFDIKYLMNQIRKSLIYNNLV